MKNKKIEKTEETKNKKKKILVILLLLFLSMFTVVDVTYTYNDNFRNKVNDMIIDTFHVETPNAPKIGTEDKNWVKKAVVKIEKDAKNYSGIDHYEYCIADSKDFSKCEWKKTETKNAVVTENGKHFVVFRGVSKNNKKGKISNSIEVWIDNNNPEIDSKKVTIEDNKVNVVINALDNESGIAKYLFSIDDKNYVESETNTYSFSDLNEGKHTIYVKVIDKVGNVVEYSEEIEINVKKEENKPDENIPEEENEPEENIPGDEPTKPEDDKPEPEEEKEYDIPKINLDKLPLEFSYGDKYDLPSFYDFGNSNGTVQCLVDGIETTDTSELRVGPHKVVCTIRNEQNMKVTVEKDITVKMVTGDDLLMDGWIRLNLYYPENSTNWQWRLARPDEIRTGDDNTSWEDYTGPIVIKLSDVENVFIRYTIDDNLYTTPPQGKLLIDIIPNKYILNKGEKTTVKIVCDYNADSCEYRIGSNNWKNYVEPFEVEANTLIEARVIKAVDVYDADGNKIGTKQNKNTDSVWISEYIPDISNPTSPKKVNGGKTGEVEVEILPASVGGYTRPSKETKPSEYIDGPIITANPNTELVESTIISINTEYPADKIYYSVNSGRWTEYTGSFTVSSNGYVQAYYIRSEDGKTSSTSYYLVNNIKRHNLPYIKFRVTPSNYLSDSVDSATVEIVASDYNTLEYSYDGVLYLPYTSALTINESKTVYAKAVNNYGETVESTTIVTLVPPKQRKEVQLIISADPEKEEVVGLKNKVKITINSDISDLPIYYKIGYYGTLQQYTGSFDLNTNAVVYASISTDDYYGNAKKQINYLTTGIAEPIIDLETSGVAQEAKVKITCASTASICRYKLDSGDYIDYSEPFYITENMTIYAMNQDELGNVSYSSRKINEIVQLPNYDVLDMGLYYIVKLNYPTSSNNNEYRWGDNGWKPYDKKGILLIKPEAKDLITPGHDGIKVYDNQAHEVIFTDNYYFINCPLSELFENIFMRWDTRKPNSPTYMLSTEEPTLQLNVGINYDNSSVVKQYKVVTPDGKDSGWLNYEKPISVSLNGTIIYAKSMNSAEVWSDVSSKTIKNIDDIGPSVEAVGDFETPKQQVSFKIVGKDNLKVEKVAYAAGDKDTTYFENDGYFVSNNGTVTVTENGKYTLYVEDAVGNKKVEIIEITNIDKTAPNILINVLTEKYGIEAQVSIDYGDSTTKDYSIGNNTNYVTYSDTITIKANDVLDLVNEDGSLTLYARGTDQAGNINEVFEKLYVLDLDAPVAPIINASAGYPLLTIYGVKRDDALSVVYDNRDDIDNYISLDNGETWQIYTGVEHISSGVVKAKSVKKESGLTIETTMNVNRPNDALKPVSYDNDTTTYESLGQNQTRIMQVDPSLWNSKFIFDHNGGQFSYPIIINFLDKNGTTLSTVNGTANADVRKQDKITIPENTYRISFVTQRDYNKIYEISVEASPLKSSPMTSSKSSSLKNLTANPLQIKLFETTPTIIKNDNTVSINYPEGYINQYSLDLGKSWINYNDLIVLDKEVTIFARTIDEKGNVISSSSMRVTSLPSTTDINNSNNGEDLLNE